MPQDSPEVETTPLEVWLEDMHRIMGASSGEPLTPDEQAALLDIARIAAHSSERVAAPLTTFLAGVAYGSLPPSERGVALKGLVERIEG